MTSHSNKLRLLLCLLAAANVSLNAQRRPDDEERPIPIGTIQYSIAQFPGPSPDSTLVDVHYRLQQQYFVFLRQSDGRYEAKGELLAEFLDESGTSAGREIRPILLRRSDLPGQSDILPDIQSFIHFTLPSRRYSVVFEVKAFESGRTFLDRTRKIDVGALAAGPALMDNPLPVFQDTGSKILIPFNRGGTILYGSSGGLLIHGRFPENTGPSAVRWKLRHQEFGDDGSLKEMSGTETISTDSHAEFESYGGRFSYRMVQGTVHGWSSFYLPLPLLRLEPGTSLIEVTLDSAGKSVSRTYRIPIFWPSQPQSLSRFDIAVDALRHIATEDEIDDMIGFMSDGGRERFREFWRRKDPDTTNAYNEMLEEYYRRVDEAIRMFSIRGELDGYKTDRGRILILFGKPTTSNRVFRANTGPREVWTYDAIRKRFIFSDPSRTGAYVLTQTEEL